MSKLRFSSLACAIVLMLSSALAGSGAAAHEIKHTHTQQPNIVTMMLKAMTQSNHGHSHQQQAYPSPQSGVTKVHADMCVKGTSWLNARSGPSTKHSVVAELGEGQRVHVTTCHAAGYGSSITWCAIKVGYGREAYVSKKYIAACRPSYNKW